MLLLFCSAVIAWLLNSATCSSFIWPDMLVTSNNKLVVIIMEDRESNEHFSNSHCDSVPLPATPEKVMFMENKFSRYNISVITMNLNLCPSKTSTVKFSYNRQIYIFEQFIPRGIVYGWFAKEGLKVSHCPQNSKHGYVKLPVTPENRFGPLEQLSYACNNKLIASNPESHVDNNGAHVLSHGNKHCLAITTVLMEVNCTTLSQTLMPLISTQDRHETWCLLQSAKILSGNIEITVPAKLGSKVCISYKSKKTKYQFCKSVKGRAVDFTLPPRINDFAIECDDLSPKLFTLDQADLNCFMPFKATEFSKKICRDTYRPILFWVSLAWLMLGLPLIWICIVVYYKIKLRFHMKRIVNTRGRDKCMSCGEHIFSGIDTSDHERCSEYCCPYCKTKYSNQLSFKTHTKKCTAKEPFRSKLESVMKWEQQAFTEKNSPRKIYVSNKLRGIWLAIWICLFFSMFMPAVATHTRHLHAFKNRVHHLKSAIESTLRTDVMRNLDRVVVSNEHVPPAEAPSSERNPETMSCATTKDLQDMHAVIQEDFQFSRSRLQEDIYKSEETILTSVNGNKVDYDELFKRIQGRTTNIQLPDYQDVKGINVEVSHASAPLLQRYITQVKDLNLARTGNCNCIQTGENTVFQQGGQGQNAQGGSGGSNLFNIGSLPPTREQTEPVVDIVKKLRSHTRRFKSLKDSMKFGKIMMESEDSSAICSLEYNTDLTVLSFLNNSFTRVRNVGLVSKQLVGSKLENDMYVENNWFRQYTKERNFLYNLEAVNKLNNTDFFLMIKDGAKVIVFTDKAQAEDINKLREIYHVPDQTQGQAERHQTVKINIELEADIEDDRQETSHDDHNITTRLTRSIKDHYEDSSVWKKRRLLTAQLDDLPPLAQDEAAVHAGKAETLKQSRIQKANERILFGPPFHFDHFGKSFREVQGKSTEQNIYNFFKKGGVVKKTLDDDFKDVHSKWFEFEDPSLKTCQVNCLHEPSTCECAGSLSGRKHDVTLTVPWATHTISDVNFVLNPRMFISAIATIDIETSTENNWHLDTEISGALELYEGSHVTWKLQNKEAAIEPTATLVITKASQIYSTSFKYFTCEREIDNEVKGVCTGGCGDYCNGRVCLGSRVWKFPHCRSWSCNPTWCWAISDGCCCCGANVYCSTSSKVASVWQLKYLRTEFIICFILNDNVQNCRLIDSTGEIDFGNVKIGLTRVLDPPERLPETILILHEPYNAKGLDLSTSKFLAEPSKVYLDPDVCLSSIGCNHGSLGDLQVTEIKCLAELGYTCGEDDLELHKSECSDKVFMSYTDSHVAMSCHSGNQHSCTQQNIVKKLSFYERLRRSKLLTDEFNIKKMRVNEQEKSLLLYVLPKAMSGTINFHVSIKGIATPKRKHVPELSKFSLFNCQGCHTCKRGFSCQIEVHQKSSEPTIVIIKSLTPAVDFSDIPVHLSGGVTKNVVWGTAYEAIDEIELCLEFDGNCLIKTTGQAKISAPSGVFIPTFEETHSSGSDGSSTCVGLDWFGCAADSIVGFFGDFWGFLTKYWWIAVLVVIGIAVIVFFPYFFQMGKVLIFPFLSVCKPLMGRTRQMIKGKGLNATYTTFKENMPKKFKEKEEIIKPEEIRLLIEDLNESDGEY